MDFRAIRILALCFYSLGESLKAQQSTRLYCEHSVYDIATLTACSRLTKCALLNAAKVQRCGSAPADQYTTVYCGRPSQTPINRFLFTVGQSFMAHILLRLYLFYFYFFFDNNSNKQFSTNDTRTLNFKLSMSYIMWLFIY